LRLAEIGEFGGGVGAAAAQVESAPGHFPSTGEMVGHHKHLWPHQDPHRPQQIVERRSKPK